MNRFMKHGYKCTCIDLFNMDVNLHEYIYLA